MTQLERRQCVRLLFDEAADGLRPTPYDRDIMADRFGPKVVGKVPLLGVANGLCGNMVVAADKASPRMARVPSVAIEGTDGGVRLNYKGA